LLARYTPYKGEQSVIAARHFAHEVGGYSLPELLHDVRTVKLDGTQLEEIPMDGEATLGGE
jgi:hypothetical protein